MNAAAIAGHTSGEAIMFAWTANWSPRTSPAWSMHIAPVSVATAPRLSTTPTWRSACIGSASWADASASAADAPVASASRQRGPYAGSAIDWVATAPIPARAHGTIEPTANMHVCTATPISPVSGSRATIE